MDDIGGFPTDCLVEDIYSSMLQMAEGWRSAYLAESLQYGLVPETYAAHVKQFARWVRSPILSCGVICPNDESSTSVELRCLSTSRDISPAN